MSTCHSCPASPSTRASDQANSKIFTPLLLNIFFLSAARKHVFPMERRVFLPLTEKNNMQPLAIKKECPKSQFTIIYVQYGSFFIFFVMCCNVLISYHLSKVQLAFAQHLSVNRMLHILVYNPWIRHVW